ncbi:MAG: hypothetical protein AB8G96_16490 [Phycisphaerales bacterium]
MSGESNESGASATRPARRRKTRHQRRQRRRGRWLRRIVVLSVLGGLVVAGVVITAEWVRRGDLPRQIVRDQLEATLGLPVELDGFRFSWGGRSEVQGLRLGLPLRDGEFLSVDSVTIEHAGIVPLALTRNLGLTSVDIVDPEITLDLGAGDLASLQEVFAARFGGSGDSANGAPAGGGGGIGIAGLPDLSLQGLTVHLAGVPSEDGPRDVKLAGGSITLQSAGRLQSDVRVDVPGVATVDGRVHGAAPWSHELRFAVQPTGDLADLLPAALGDAVLVRGALDGRTGPVNVVGRSAGGANGGATAGVVTGNVAGSSRVPSGPPSNGYSADLRLDAAQAAGASVRGGLQIAFAGGTADVQPASLVVELPAALAEALAAAVEPLGGLGVGPHTVRGGRVTRGTDGLIMVDGVGLDAHRTSVLLDAIVDPSRGRAGVRVDVSGDGLGDPSEAMRAMVAEDSDAADAVEAALDRAAAPGDPAAQVAVSADAAGKPSSTAADPVIANPRGVDPVSAPAAPAVPAAPVVPIDPMDALTADDAAESATPTGLAIHAAALATWTSDGAWTVDAVVETGGRAPGLAGAGAIRVRGASADAQQQWRIIADDVVVDRGTGEVIALPPLSARVRGEADAWSLESADWLPAGTRVMRPEAAWAAIQPRVIASDEPGIGTIVEANAPAVDRPGRAASDAAARQWASQNVALTLRGVHRPADAPATALHADMRWTGDVRELVGLAPVSPAASGAAARGSTANGSAANGSAPASDPPVANRFTIDLDRIGDGPVDATLQGLVDNAAMVGRGRWAPELDRPLELDVSVRPRSGDRFATPVSGWTVAELDADLDVRGGFDPVAFDATGSVRLARVLAGDEPIGDVVAELRATGNDERIAAELMSGDVFGGPVSVDGTWWPATTRLEATIDAAPDPDRVPWSQILPPTVASALDVRAIGPLQASVVIAPSAFSPPPSPSPSPSAATSPVTVAGGESASASGAANASDTPIRITFSTQAIDLATADVSFGVDAADGTITVRGDIIEVERLAAERNGGRATARGVYRLGSPAARPAPGPFDTDLAIGVTSWPISLPERDVHLVIDGTLEVSEVVRMDPALAGAARAAGLVDADAARPIRPIPGRPAPSASAASSAISLVAPARTLAGDADLRFRGRMAGRDVADVEVDARITGDTLDLHAISGQVLDGALSGQGHVDLNDPLGSDLVVDLVAARPERLAIVWPPVEAVTGALDGRLEIGPSADPRAPKGLHLVAAWEPIELAVTGLDIGPGVVTGHYDPRDGRVVLRQAQMELAGGRIEAWGRVAPNATGRTAYLELAAVDLDLAILGERFLPDQPMVGRVGAKASGTAPIDDLARAFGQGNLTLTQSDLGAVPVFSEIYGLLNLDFVSQKPRGTGIGQFRFEEGTLIVPDLRYQNRGAQVVLDVRVDDVLLGPAGRIRGNVRASQSLLPEVDFLSSVNDALSVLQRDVLNARLEGTLANPVIRPGSLLDFGDDAR